MASTYEAIIAQLDENVARTASHLDGLLDDYDTTLGRLRDHAHGAIPHETSAVVRALESIAAETLQIVALLNHRGHDHPAARRAVERMRRLEEITVRLLRPNE